MSMFQEDYTKILLDECQRLVDQETKNEENGYQGEMVITSKSLIGSLTCSLLTYYNGKDQETRDMALGVMQSLFEDYFIEHVSNGETIH